MTLETYKRNVYQLREIHDKICKAEEALDTNFFEGTIGHLYDMIYDLMIPEGAPDEIYDQFGYLIFDEEISEDAIEKFFIKLFKF